MNPGSARGRGVGAGVGAGVVHAVAPAGVAAHARCEPRAVLGVGSEKFNPRGCRPPPPPPPLGLAHEVQELEPAAL
jgi:hypothetical protein